tara:strand:+ start:2384 stop:2803 length:420 start_codon:yes stop_codon:yes gene_type:complete
MNATEPFTLDPEPVPSPAPEALCGGSFNPFDCAAGEFDAEHRFLAIVILSLAVTTCALYVLVCVLTLLVHKIGAIWTRAALGKAVEQSDPNDARKGLLEEGARKSSFSTARKAEGKKKRASFAEDTSCAPTRDVDEEDL